MDGLVYFASAGLTVSATRFDGGVAFIWIASAFLIARLLGTSQRSWWLALAPCLVASMAVTVMFGLGPLSAVPIAAANLGEAVLAAWLLRRSRMPDAPFQSLDWMARFILAVGVAAPLASGLAGATIAHFAVGAAWGSSMLRWYAGHALGNLTFTPIAVLLIRGDIGRWAGESSRRRMVEAVLLLLLVATITLAVFLQDGMPLLFLPMLPLILATFRIGRFGAAASIVILALIGGACTLLGRGPISLMDVSQGTQLQFFQFYLATTVLTVLPVAADLARRGRLFRALRDSEARYRVLAETSTDIILNLDVDGRIRFVSPSIRQLGGYEPEDLIGRSAGLLIAPEHRDRVREAHARTIAARGEAVVVDYLACTRTGDARWFETNARAIVTETGEVDGVVSVVRDIADRKDLESRLAAEAMTDPLTGLPNRRAFVSLMERHGGEPACIALFDIDHFKRVNDRWGHAAGDAVLQTFAQVARRTLRGDDHVARIGGEEFAVLLPRATLDQARLVCERLRRAVANTVTLYDGVSIPITTSGGVALLSGPLDAVLKAADAALYQAKTDGRDRLAIAA